MRTLDLYLMIPPLLALLAAWLGSQAIRRSSARIDAAKAEWEASRRPPE